MGRLCKQADLEHFCGSVPRAVGLGLDVAFWKRGWGFSEHFRKLLTVPHGSLAELFQDELAFGLMNSPANTQTTGIYFHSWNKIYST